MNTDNIIVIIARVGSQMGRGAVMTKQALVEMAVMTANPYIKFREETNDLVWEGPAEAYYEYFHNKESEQIANNAIRRAMRR